MIFETIAKTGHEEVVFCHNKDAGLKAIIAIHNTRARPGPRRLAHVALRDRAGRAQRRAAPVPRHDLQGGRGRA